MFKSVYMYYTYINIYKSGSSKGNTYDAVLVSRCCRQMIHRHLAWIVKKKRYANRLLIFQFSQPLLKYYIFLRLITNINITVRESVWVEGKPCASEIFLCMNWDILLYFSLLFFHQYLSPPMVLLNMFSDKNFFPHTHWFSPSLLSLPKLVKVMPRTRNEFETHL